MVPQPSEVPRDSGATHTINQSMVGRIVGRTIDRWLAVFCGVLCCFCDRSGNGDIDVDEFSEWYMNEGDKMGQKMKMVMITHSINASIIRRPLFIALSCLVSPCSPPAPTPD